LNLSFGKYANKGNSQYFNWFFRMEQHFYSYPIGKPANKSRNEWD